MTHESPVCLPELRRGEGGVFRQHLSDGADGHSYGVSFEL